MAWLFGSYELGKSKSNAQLLLLTSLYYLCLSMSYLKNGVNQL